MSDQELLSLIALNLHFRNYPRKARILMDMHGSAEAAMASLPDDGRRLSYERAEKELAFVRKHAISLFVQGSDSYPYRLNECPDAPLLLYGKGNIRPNDGHFLSIVGTRSATDRGKVFTRQLVLDLAANVPNLTIISGLAYGIDVTAHLAALEANIPTLVVLGHGLDRIYPSVHRDIAVRTLKDGGLLCEYPSGTEPERMNFVARDRIIAGLADAVVVVESREKGGSLITAGMASDYDREIFAVPGRSTDEQSLGCNRLIQKNAAHLLLSAEDIIREMQWERKLAPTQTQMINLFENLTEDEQALLDQLHTNEDGVHINSLVMETGIAYAEAAAILMELEMRELVRGLPGGIYRALK